MEAPFSGVMLVSRGDETLLAEAAGYAHIGYGVENTVDTRFAIASGTKGFTALVVVGLIAEGTKRRIHHHHRLRCSPRRPTTSPPSTGIRRKRRPARSSATTTAPSPSSA